MRQFHQRMSKGNFSVFYVSLCLAVVLFCGGCNKADAQSAGPGHTGDATGGYSITNDTDSEQAMAQMGAEAVSVFPQLGHSSGVASVAYSPDGRRIVSIGEYLKVWDAETGREIRTLAGGGSSVAYSPDGRRIVSGSEDKTLKIWNAETGQELRTLTGHSGYVNSVAYSPDGRRIVSGSEDKTLKIWDAETGRELRTLAGHNGWVDSVAYSPDGRRIVSGSGTVSSVREPDGAIMQGPTEEGDKTLKVWDAETGRELHTLAAGPVISVAYSPDGRRIVSGSSDATLKIWDAETGRELRTLAGHGSYNWVYSVAYSPDGRHIVSGSDRTLKVWDAETGRELRSLDAHGRQVTSVAYSPDGRCIVSAESDLSPPYKGALKIWDAKTGRELRTLAGHSGEVTSVAYSPDGRRIVSGGNTLKIWDAETGREVRTLTGHSEYVNSVAYSPDGRRIVSDDTVWDAETGQELRTFAGEAIFSAYSPDGRHIVSGVSPISFEKITIWDAETGQVLRTIDFPGSPVAYSPDGRRIISGYGYRSSGVTTIWDAETGRELWTLGSNYGNVNAVTYSPDGRRIVSGGKYLKVWDAETGQELRTLAGGGSPVAYSPDGRCIVSGGNTLKIWDAETGQELRTFTAHSGGVNSVAYSPDGQRILSGSEDGTVRIWDAESGKEIAQFIGFNDGEWVCLTPDGFYNASPNGDKYLNVRVGNNVYGIDQYRTTFYNPAIVDARLGEAGDIIRLADTSTPTQNVARPVPPTNTVSTTQNEARPVSPAATGVTIQNAALAPPEVIIRNPANGISLTINQVDISVAVNGRTQSIQNIKVLVNGRVVAQDEGANPSGGKGMSILARLQTLDAGGVNKKQTEFTLKIPLDPGTNRIEVLAHNGYSEGRALVEVSFSTNQNTLPNLYILAIGVNQYTDNAIPGLKYAANDARGIITAFKTQEGKRYSRVNSRLVADGGDFEPTRDNIVDGMDFLKSAGPRDVVILFISGHGGTDDRGDYFFMPQNTSFTPSGTPQRSRIIPNSDLLDVLNLPAQKLVFIDSCYSAGIAGKQVDGVDNNRLINSLKDNTPVVFTSSQGSERSWEWDPSKYGLFTHVLLQGLSGAADTGPNGNKDGKVQIEELGQYVRTTVPGLKDIQHPYYLVPTGYTDFVIAEIER